MPDKSDHVRIAVIDDHPVVIQGIHAWTTEADPPIDVVAEFATPQQFRRDGNLTPNDVDVVVLDLIFNPTVGADLSAVEDICQAGYRVLIYTQETGRMDLVRACLHAGALTYLSKAEAKGHLVLALHAAAYDVPFLSPLMAGALSADTAPDAGISATERNVLETWYETDSKPLAAKALGMTVRDFDYHLKRIRTKYVSVERPAPTKTKLIARAVADGIIRPDELDHRYDKRASNGSG